MIELCQHDHDYLAICRHYQAIFTTSCVQDDETQWKSVSCGNAHVYVRTCMNIYIWWFHYPSPELGGGVCLGRLVWFVVDEYYCSETTTTQACLGHVLVSLGIHSADEGQPAQNSTVCLVCSVHTLFYVCAYTASDYIEP